MQLFLKIFLFIFLLSFVFSACAVNNSGNHTAEGHIDENTVRITWYWNESNVHLPEDSYICKKIREDLGIEYIHIYPRGTDYEEKLDVLISSGDVPDIISSYGTLTTKLVKQSIIRPVEKYLNDNYIPNVIKIQDKWETAVKYLTRNDGHVYAVPNCNTDMMEEIPFIRYDWLEKLGLEVPGSFEELKEVLISFTHNDPDGNNKNDTAGTMINEFWGMIPYALNFGASHFEWYPDGRGGVTLGMFHPRHVKYLEYVRSLIETGAMDEDIATTRFNEVIEGLFSGKVGFLYQWLDPDKGAEIRKADPDADWRPMVPPKGIYDRGYMPCSGIIRDEYCISTQCDAVEDVFRLMNYMADDKSTENKIDYSGAYWTMKHGERGAEWDVTKEGYLLMHENSGPADNKNRHELLVLAKRFNSRYDKAWRFELSEEAQLMYKELDTYPLKIHIPETDEKRPLATEMVSIPADTALFCQKWQFEEWPDFFYKVILGSGDIESEWARFVKRAEEDGLRDINKKMSLIFNEVSGGNK